MILSIIKKKKKSTLHIDYTLILPLIVEKRFACNIKLYILCPVKERADSSHAD